MDERLALKLPLIQAPMGGVATPQLAAAVSNTGALGSLGGGYMTPEELQKVVRETKVLTKHPFGVNLFVLEKDILLPDLLAALEFIKPFWKELTDELLEVPTELKLPAFEEQVEVLLEEKISVFSFTFGIPSEDIIQRFRKQGILVFGTATNPREAILLERVGCDGIVCQGYEAGGHRGCFSNPDPCYSLSVLLSLTKRVVKLPLIAAGGIMDGYGIAAALAMGAKYAQLGTAFVTTIESGANQAYKKALLEENAPTKLSKAFTGKLARLIENRFVAELGKKAVLPYPVQHFLTAKLRALAAQKGRMDLMFLLAGQGYPLCQSISARDLIQQMAYQLFIAKARGA